MALVLSMSIVACGNGNASGDVVTIDSVTYKDSTIVKDTIVRADDDTVVTGGGHNPDAIK